MATGIHGVWRGRIPVATSFEGAHRHAHDRPWSSGVQFNRLYIQSPTLAASLRQKERPFPMPTTVPLHSSPYVDGDMSAPKANAICERFLGSVRRECLDHSLILSERHLHRIMKEYGEYFNRARPHQGLGQRIPCRPVQMAGPSESRQVVSCPVLGGLHHNYQWRADERPSYRRAA